jgi:PST family polysaccharide transporter
MNDQQHSFFGSLKWAFYMTWADRAFAVLFTFLLAAILGPRDFGTVALALIYIAVVQLLLEGGIQTTVVQREGLEEDHLDSAFWIMAWKRVGRPPQASAPRVMLMTRSPMARMPSVAEREPAISSV